MSNIWHDISPKRITPEDFICVIEISKGSRKKYELDNLVLWDTPGLGDGVDEDKRHAKNIINKLIELEIIKSVEHLWWGTAEGLLK